MAAALATAIAALGCSGPQLAQPGRPFDDTRTSLKAGTVSAEDAREIDAIRREALAGDARSQTVMGLLYQTGQGVPRNTEEAKRWFHRAAEQDECAAQYHLGLLHLQRNGVPPDVDEATLWLRRASDHSAAVQEASFRRLASKVGLAPVRAAAKVGKGIAGAALPDAGEPAATEPAVADERATAIYELGEDYRTGRGVAMDEAHAVRWYRTAAEAGHPGAQYRLGQAYRDGHGLRADPLRAHQWLNLAAAGGNRDARRELSELEQTLSDQQVATAEQLAWEWHHQSRNE